MSKEDRKAIEKYRKEMGKRQKAFKKEMKPMSEQRNKIMKELKTCKLCQNKKYKFILCKAHEKAMKTISEKAMKTQFYYKLKLDLFPVPQPKIKMRPQMPRATHECCPPHKPHN